MKGIKCLFCDEYDVMKGIKCLFCDEYDVARNIDKDWFLCLSCGLDYELDKIKEIKNV